MAAIKAIEDIEVWKEARKLAGVIYRLAKTGALSRDFSLRDQMCRAGVSIACNIAEGFARDSNVEFRRFLCIARGSVTELKTQVYIASDIGYIDEDTTKSLCANIDRVGRMISRFMDYLRNTPNPSPTPRASANHETM